MLTRFCNLLPPSASHTSPVPQKAMDLPTWQMRVADTVHFSGRGLKGARPEGSSKLPALAVQVELASVFRSANRLLESHGTAEALGIAELKDQLEQAQLAARTMTPDQLLEAYLLGQCRSKLATLDPQAPDASTKMLEDLMDWIRQNQRKSSPEPFLNSVQHLSEVLADRLAGTSDVGLMALVDDMQETVREARRWYQTCSQSELVFELLLRQPIQEMAKPEPKLDQTEGQNATVAQEMGALLSVLWDQQLARQLAGWSCGDIALKEFLETKVQPTGASLQLMTTLYQMAEAQENPAVKLACGAALSDVASRIPQFTIRQDREHFQEFCVALNAVQLDWIDGDIEARERLVRLPKTGQILKGVLEPPMLLLQFVQPEVTPQAIKRVRKALHSAYLKAATPEERFKILIALTDELGFTVPKALQSQLTEDLKNRWERVACGDPMDTPRMKLRNLTRHFIGSVDPSLWNTVAGSLFYDHMVGEDRKRIVDLVFEAMDHEIAKRQLSPEVFLAYSLAAQKYLCPNNALADALPLADKLPVLGQFAQVLVSTAMTQSALNHQANPGGALQEILAKVPDVAALIPQAVQVAESMPGDATAQKALKFLKQVVPYLPEGA